MESPWPRFFIIVLAKPKEGQDDLILISLGKRLHRGGQRISTASACHVDASRTLRRLRSRP